MSIYGIIFNMKCVMYRILRFTLKPFYKVLYMPKFEGCENIPSTGAFVFAGNHTSFMDAAMIVSTPKRIIHTLSKKELFKGKIRNAFFRSMACIPVDRKTHDEKAKKEVIDMLKSGHAVGIFPEGTINRTIGTKDEVSLLPFKKGAVSFAKKVSCPIVPFAIVGKYRIFRKGLKVIYGKPYYVKSDDIEKETTMLRDKVLKLKEGVLDEN